jgi:small nuclear ribonucleoprotein (snRNP)-like protein
MVTMVELKENDTFYDLLFQFKKENKQIEITMKSGNTIGGTIQTIGRHNVLLKTSRRDFQTTVTSRRR